jgi:hypothetical protein
LDARLLLAFCFALEGGATFSAKSEVRRIVKAALKTMQRQHGPAFTTAIHLAKILKLTAWTTHGDIVSLRFSEQGKRRHHNTETQRLHMASKLAWNRHYLRNTQPRRRDGTLSFRKTFSLVCAPTSLA